MHNRRSLLHSLPLLFLVGTGITLFSGKLQAQAISGDLVGTVTDASGAIVPNVTVTATNAATSIESSTTSNGNGLPPVEPSARRLQRLSDGRRLHHVQVEERPGKPKSNEHSEYHPDCRLGCHLG